jgi:hypothetical protein
MRKTIVFALVMLVAGLAAAQGVPVPCTLTIASGQSLSSVLTVNPTNCPGATSTTSATPLQIHPMDLAGNAVTLAATSYGLLIYSCLDAAGTHCSPGQDAAGNKLLIPLLGTTSPSSFVQIDPEITVGGASFKVQVVTSAGIGVAQSSQVTFSVMVRPL